MENKDAIRVGEEFAKGNLCNKIMFVAGKKGETFYTLSAQAKETFTHLISLAKDYEQARLGLPTEERLLEIGKKYYYRWYDKSFKLWVKAIRHQTALGMVKFKKKLPEIIKKYFFKSSISEQVTDKTCMICGSPFREETWEKQRQDLSQAILSEMGVGK